MLVDLVLLLLVLLYRVAQRRKTVLVYGQRSDRKETNVVSLLLLNKHKAEDANVYPETETRENAN